jgi:hypothetical protein
VTRAYVGLGANLGDRERTLREAVDALGDEEGIEVVAVSTLRETDPVGVGEQPSGSQSPASPFRTPACTSVASSSSRLPSWIRDSSSPVAAPWRAY